MGIRIVTLAYNTEGKGTGGGAGPEVIMAAGLAEELRKIGHAVGEPWDVCLLPEEERQYGGWNRVALANGHLQRLVTEAVDEGSFVLCLLADCNGCLGVLGGMQGSGSAPKVGLVYVDAHGDYNTPDTSPSGMLGGMPVAIAAGKCMPRHRERSGMMVPLQYSSIVMAGMRDLDEMEREAIIRDGLTVITEDDLRKRGQAVRDAMDTLSETVDAILVHVDLDIMDPSLAPAAGLPSKGGLSGAELGAVLKDMLNWPKVRILSIASYKAERDVDGQTLAQVMEALVGALRRA